MGRRIKHVPGSTVGSTGSHSAWAHRIQPVDKMKRQQARATVMAWVHPVAGAKPGARPMALAAKAVEKSENAADRVVAPKISGAWRFMRRRWPKMRNPKDRMTTPRKLMSRSPAPIIPFPCGACCHIGTQAIHDLSLL